MLISDTQGSGAGTATTLEDVTAWFTGAGADVSEGDGPYRSAAERTGGTRTGVRVPPVVDGRSADGI
ncbi:hypothetical protein [Streptomyces yangpuensis]|uniref:hypothetical protein n=1 Tax=Streptomyces yangpuensis TaxID=1648182 RepID=UPI003808C2E7